MDHICYGRTDVSYSHHRKRNSESDGKSIDNNQEQYFKYIIIYYCIFILYSPVHIKNIPEVFRDILSKSEIQYVKLCVKLINERLFNHTDAYTIPARIIVD